MTKQIEFKGAVFVVKIGKARGFVYEIRGAMPGEIDQIDEILLSDEESEEDKVLEAAKVAIGGPEKGITLVWDRPKLLGCEQYPFWLVMFNQTWIEED